MSGRNDAAHERGTRAALTLVRPSRIATAQARIAADYYSRGDVRESIVDTLLLELEKI